MKLLNKTDEFSFILKPSKYSIGVFVSHNFKKGKEVLIDYNSLEEPESSKEEYYYA